MRHNYRILGEGGKAKNLIFYGSILTVILIVVLFIVPFEVPSYVIPFAYTGAAYGITQECPLKKHEIEESRFYDFKSNIKVGWITLISLISFLVLGFLIMIILGQMGYISLDE